MLSDESINRVTELAARYRRLRQWGVRAKLPHTIGTQDDLERFFNDARKGKIDVTEIASVTADVRRLEKYAEEYDAAKNLPDGFKQEKLRTTFDIETSAEDLKFGKQVVDSSNDFKAAARDATKDGFAALREGAKIVPLWAWIAGGFVVGAYILAQIATVARILGGSRK